MNQDFILTVTIALAIGFIVYLITASKKGDTNDELNESNLLSIKADASPTEVLKIVLRFANQSGFKIDSIDEEKFKVVLNEESTFTKTGFIYYVYLRQDNGITIIDLDVKSKYGMGILQKKSSMERFYNGLKATIFANT